MVCQKIWNSGRLFWRKEPPGVEATQVIWCLAVYAGSLLFSRYVTKPGPPGGKSEFRKHFMAVLWGMGAIFAADQLSPETPLWPALTFLTLLGGMLFPLPEGRRSPKMYYGFSGYWGGLLYLDPWLSLVALFLTFEIYIITGDGLAGCFLFVSLIPLLLGYARWHPGFIWAAAGIGVLTLVYFYPALRQRWRSFWKPAPPSN